VPCERRGPTTISGRPTSALQCCTHACSLFVPSKTVDPVSSAPPHSSASASRVSSSRASSPHQGPRCLHRSRVGDTRRPRATARGAFLLLLLLGVVATGSGVYRREAGAGGWIQGGGHFFRARDPIFGSGDPISRSRDPIVGSGDPISRSRDLGYRVTPPPVGISTHLLMLGAARPLRAVLAYLSSSGQ